PTPERTTLKTPAIAISRFPSTSSCETGTGKNGRKKSACAQPFSATAGLSPTPARSRSPQQGRCWPRRSPAASAAPICMLLSEPLLLEVPNGLPAAHAALTEPLAVGVHAVAKANIVGGEVPLVIGCGPVGLAVIAALKIKGLHPIVAADYSPARRALAEK